MNNPVEPLEGLYNANIKPSEAHKYRAFEVSEVREIEKQRDNLRTALLLIV